MRAVTTTTSWRLRARRSPSWAQTFRLMSWRDSRTCEPRLCIATSHPRGAHRGGLPDRRSRPDSTRPRTRRATCCGRSAGAVGRWVPHPRPATTRYRADLGGLSGKGSTRLLSRQERVHSGCREARPRRPTGRRRQAGRQDTRHPSPGPRHRRGRPGETRGSRAHAHRHVPRTALDVITSLPNFSTRSGETGHRRTISHRSERVKLLMSSANSSGTSTGAKWPPCGART
jgi:hypothetical protein